jgi:hypothetical protein
MTVLFLTFAWPSHYSLLSLLVGGLERVVLDCEDLRTLLHMLLSQLQ